LDDAMHFQDHLLCLLSKKHSAFRSFAHDFSEAVFIRDRDDEAAVCRLFESKGIDWNYAIRAKAGALQRRIRHYIPSPSILFNHLKTLFHAYQDLTCSIQSSKKSQPHTFFDQSAQKMADSLLGTAWLGFLSDPPDIPLYYKMGTDRDGLTIYRTICGTSSVEGGVHMAICRVFGSLQASPDLAESLLINWIGHRTVGYIYFFLIFIILLIQCIRSVITIEQVGNTKDILTHG
jgi:hypothetical protein